MSNEPNSEYQGRLELAISVVREAGVHVMHLYQSDALSVEHKVDATPVTNADRGAEELMRKRLAAACPNDGVIGEELGDETGTSGYSWYLDPIDGTQSFIRGVPLFGTMVGLEHNGEAVAGVIFMPALAEIVYAARGSGAWWATATVPGAALAPRRALVSAVGSVADATVSATSARHFEPSAFEHLTRTGGLARGWGDCYGHYLVATGRVDAMVDPLMSVWDCAPLLPIVTEAGGRFTTVGGDATIHGGSAVSTNGLVHDEVLRLMRG